MAFCNDGETRKFTASNNRVTVSITDPLGTVLVNQSNGAGGWFPMVVLGELQTLDAYNTVRSIYAPVDLQFIASGTDLIVKG